MPVAEDLKPGSRGATGILVSPFAWRLLRFTHTSVYRLTNGRIGHHSGKQTLLLLTYTGASSGLRRTTGLQYRRDGDAFIVVASKGGSADDPLWYKSLVKNPEAQVQAGDQKIRVRARTASLDEKPRLWELMLENNPAYDDYQAATDRAIPVVVLERAQ